MELCIPLHTLQTANLRIGQLPRSGGKPLLPVGYTDGDIRFSAVTVLLPLLPVKSYDTESGRLMLSFTGAGAAATKLQSLQDTLVTAVTQSYRHVWPGEAQKEASEIRAGFQPMYHHGTLNLYCPNGDVPIYHKGAWNKTKLSAALLTAGTPVRIAIRIQGISFHQHPVTGVWTGRFRLQHRVMGIFLGGGGGGSAA